MTIPLGRLAEVNPTTPEFATDPDAEVTFMPLECVWADGKVDTSRRARAGAVAGAYTLFRSGDVLVPKITPTFEAGRVTVADLETALGAGTTELHVLRPKAGVDARFLAYVCRAESFLQDGASRLQGVGNLRRVPSDYLFKYAVPKSAVRNQSRIADYLDRETAQIDTLISEQGRLITLVRERREASAAHDLVGAKNEGVSTQETDLFWAPKIPADWRVVPLTSVARLESGHTPSRTNPDLWTDCHIPWISLNDLDALGESTPIHSTANLISDAGISASSARLLPAGTVALSRDATVGRSGIMGVPMATSQHFANWVCSDALLPEYLNLLFRTVMQPYFASLTNGSTLRTIGMGIIKSFRIPLPPVSTQRRIIAKANLSLAMADQLIEASRDLIVLSRERRAALITAAVTGQIEVPED